MPARKPKLVVRRATVADAAAIAELHAASWLATYRGKMPRAMLKDVSAEAFLERRLDHLERETEHHPGGRTFVIEARGAVRGFAVTGPCREAILGGKEVDPRGVGELYAIYLHPKWIGRGLGLPLWHAALADLHSRGFKEVTVSVLESNERARRFYEHLGFILDSTGIRVLGKHQIPHVLYRLALER